MARPSFSWSLLVLGSMATSITGSGKVIDSSTTWLFGIAQGVTGGGVLQADHRRRCDRRAAVSTGFSLLECIWNSLPSRSFLPLVALMTCAPESTLPEYTRT